MSRVTIHIQISKEKSVPKFRKVEGGFRCHNFLKLVELLVRDFEDGRLPQLGIVADADHTSGGGFENRWKTITGTLRELDYKIPEKPPALAGTGSIFDHNDGLPSVGLFLMPDHKTNGMLDDLLWSSLKDENKELMDCAVKVMGKFPKKDLAIIMI